MSRFYVFFGVDTFGQCNGLNVTVGPDIEACNGSSITLTATYTGEPNSDSPTYQWYFNNGGGGGYVIIPGAISNTYTIPNFNNSTDGTYSCTVIFPNVNNCSESDNVNVDFPNNNNNFNLTSGNDFTICPQVTANINSSISNIPAGGTVSYSWISDPAQNDIYTYQVKYRKKARAADPQPDRIITGHVTIIR